jgi:hypothetical protein
MSVPWTRCPCHYKLPRKMVQLDCWTWSGLQLTTFILLFKNHVYILTVGLILSFLNSSSFFMKNFISDQCQCHQTKELITILCTVGWLSWLHRTCDSFPHHAHIRCLFFEFTWYVSHYLAQCTSPEWWWMMSMEQPLEWLTGETEVLTEYLPHFHFVHHKSHMLWPGLPWWELTVYYFSSQIYEYFSSF